MKDLYEILGIKRSCRTADIKEAYKKQAMTLHPDKVTGSEEAFKALNEAYSILSDKDKRRKYDAGESVVDVPPLVKIAKDRLVDMFSQAIEKARDDKDLVEVVRASIASGAINFQSSIDQMNTAIAKYEHVLSRITYTGNDDGNLFAGTVNQKIYNCKAQIELLSKELELTKLVIELLNDYECKVEKKPLNSFYSRPEAGVYTTGWPP